MEDENKFIKIFYNHFVLWGHWLNPTSLMILMGGHLWYWLLKRLQPFHLMISANSHYLISMIWLMTFDIMLWNLFSCVCLNATKSIRGWSITFDSNSYWHCDIPPNWISILPSYFVFASSLVWYGIIDDGPLMLAW